MGLLIGGWFRGVFERDAAEIPPPYMPFLYVLGLAGFMTYVFTMVWLGKKIGAIAGVVVSAGYLASS